MELTKRRLQILQTVVEEYIEHAQPVGSIVLARRCGLNVSAATLRNEMAALEKLGFLEKPHSSAGRRPTNSAYRLYVGTMLRSRPLSDEELEQLGDSFSTPMDEVREICRAAAGVLSSMTGCTAVVAAPSLGETVFRSVDFVRLDDARILAILIAATGFARHFLLPTEQAPTESDLREMSMTLSQAVNGIRFSNAGDAVVALSKRWTDQRSDVIKELATAINRNKDEMEMYLDGRQNVWLHPEYQDWQKARQLLALLDTQEWLESMLHSSSDAEFTLRFGPEAAQSLTDLCVVTGTYSAGAASRAAFSIVGPARMNYRRVLPILRDVGARMSAALSRLTATKS